MTIGEQWDLKTEGYGLHLLIIHSGGHKKEIKVIDEAIFVAKALVNKLNITYIPFDSRYCDVLEATYINECCKIEEEDDLIDEILEKYNK